MNKLKLDGIIIEITRRCNLRCEHCCRGEAQNIDISKEVIDAILDNCDSIGKIDITGGEPLLAIDKIEYLIDQIIIRNIPVNAIGCITNGTIYDERILDVWDRFLKSGDTKIVGFSCSTDVYHNHSNNIFMKYKDEISRRGLHILTSPNPDYGTIAFYLEGRAARIPKEKRPAKGVRYETQHTHRVSILDNRVFCELSLSVNGNIGMELMKSYKWQDLNCIGNILKSNLYNIITEHNKHCLRTCQELMQLEETKSMRFVLDEAAGISQIEKKEVLLNSLIFMTIYERICAARETIHTDLPFIPVEQIIAATPIRPFSYRLPLDYKKILDESDAITDSEALNYCPHDLIPTATEYKALIPAIKVLALFNRNTGNICPNRIYGSGDIREKPIYQELSKINDDYKTGDEIYSNNSVIGCDMIKAINDIISDENNIQDAISTIDAYDNTFHLQNKEDLSNADVDDINKALAKRVNEMIQQLNSYNIPIPKEYDPEYNEELKELLTEWG